MPTASHPSGRTLRRLGASAVVVGTLVVGTLTLGAAPATATPADEQALAERYAPVVRLVEQAEECGPGEPFVPTDVDAVLGDDTVALRGPWDTDDLVTIGPDGADLAKGLSGYHLDFPGSPLSPGCSYEQWAREVTKGSPPTTYARVVAEPGRDGLSLQYWLYYPFNDFNNKHESDWEMVQLEFAAADAAGALGQEPTRIGYSQHEGVELADWDDVKLQVVDGTHPVVYAAAGSHANYFDSSLFLGRSSQQGFGCDDTRGPSRDVRPAVALVPSDPAAVGAEYPWLDYTGHWGQRETSFYNGPTGPNTKDQWAAPLSWSDDEGAATAYAVPASGLYGTTATSSFCGIVATGSDLLRLAMNNLAVASLALLGVALVVSWLVRRTTWRPSAPLRLVRRRSTGQVIAAVWRMYLGRILLFVGIGVPIAVATLLPGIATVWVTSVTDSMSGTATVKTFIVTLVGLVLTVLSPVTLALGQAATMFAARAIDEGRPIGPLRAYAGALRRAVPLLLTLAGLGVVLFLLAVTLVLLPVAVVALVLSLLITPVVLFEGISGWRGVRRSAHLVRRNWLKVVVLVALTNALVLAIGPVLGTTLILGTSLPFSVSNAVAGIVYALFIPLVALNTVYVYADIVVRDELEPRQDKDVQMPAEVSLP